MSCIINVDGRQFDEAGFKQYLADGFLKSEIESGTFEGSSSNIYDRYGNVAPTNRTGSSRSKENTASQGQGENAATGAAEGSSANKANQRGRLSEKQLEELRVAVDLFNKVNRSDTNILNYIEVVNKLMKYYGPDLSGVTNFNDAIQKAMAASERAKELRDKKYANSSDGSIFKVKQKFVKTAVKFANALASLNVTVVYMTAPQWEAFRTKYKIGDSDAIYDPYSRTIVMHENPNSNNPFIAARFLHEMIHPIVNEIKLLDPAAYQNLVEEAKLILDKEHPLFDGITIGGFIKGYKTEEIANDEAIVEVLNVLATTGMKLNFLDKSAFFGYNSNEYSKFLSIFQPLLDKILEFFGAKPKSVLIDTTNWSSINKLAETIRLAGAQKRAIRILGYNPMNTTLSHVDYMQESKNNQYVGSSISTENSKPLVEQSGDSKYMTEDGKGNYAFFHYSFTDLGRKSIDPEYLGHNAHTGRDETGGMAPNSFYYTEPEVRDIAADHGYLVTVPKDKVYPADSDPLNFREKAFTEFRKVFPAIAFDNNRAVSWIAKVAAEHGFDMVVTKWKAKGYTGLRAQSAVKMKQTWLSKPEYLGSNFIKDNPKIAPLKSNRFSSKSDIQSSLPLPGLNTFKSNSEEVFKQVQSGNLEGGTFNIDGTSYSPSSGIVVPIASKNLDRSKINADSMHEFMSEHPDVFVNNNVKPGFYLGLGNNQGSFDINVVVPEKYKDVGLRFAASLGQESVWDFGSGSSITTGENGLNPSTLTDDQIVSAINSLEKGEDPNIQDSKKIKELDNLVSELVSDIEHDVTPGKTIPQSVGTKKEGSKGDISVERASEFNKVAVNSFLGQHKTGVITVKKDGTKIVSKIYKSIYNRIALENKGKKISEEQLKRGIIDFYKKNIMFIFNKVKSTPYLEKLGYAWYMGANVIAKEMAAKYGYSLEQMAASIAALSPQNEWTNNVFTSQFLVDFVYNTNEDSVFTKEMYDVFYKTSENYAEQRALRPYFKSLIGSKLLDLLNSENEDDKKAYISAARYSFENEIGKLTRERLPSGELGTEGSGATSRFTSFTFALKLLSILKDGSVENIDNIISDDLKVRSFYNNIVDPTGTNNVTVDTHAYAAGFMSPMGGNAKEVKFNGVPYTFMHEAYNEIASEQNIIPCRLQSIVWEAARCLFPKASKKSGYAYSEDVWESYGKGEITQEEAWNKIVDYASEFGGSITNPKWEKIIKDIHDNYKNRNFIEDFSLRKRNLDSGRGGVSKTSDGGTSGVGTGTLGADGGIDSDIQHSLSSLLFLTPEPEIQNSSKLRGTAQRAVNYISSNNPMASGIRGMIPDIESNPDAYVDPMKLSKFKGQLYQLSEADIVTMLNASTISRIMNMDPDSNLALMAMVEAANRAAKSPSGEFGGIKYSDWIVDIAKKTSVAGRILRIARELNTTTTTTYFDTIVAAVESTGTVLSPDAKSGIMRHVSTILSANQDVSVAKDMARATQTAEEAYQAVRDVEAAEHQLNMSFNDLLNYLKPFLPINLADQFISQMQGNLLVIPSLGVNFTSVLAGFIGRTSNMLAKSAVSLVNYGAMRALGKDPSLLPDMFFLTGLTNMGREALPALRRGGSILANGTNRYNENEKFVKATSMSIAQVVRAMLANGESFRRISNGDPHDVVDNNNGSFNVVNRKSGTSVGFFTNKRAADQYAYELSTKLDKADAISKVATAFTGTTAEAMFRMLSATDEFTRSMATSYYKASHASRSKLSQDQLISLLLEDGGSDTELVQNKAARAVFQEERHSLSKLNQFIGSTNRKGSFAGDIAKIIARMVMPYVITPTNIIIQFGELALFPISAIRGILDMIEAHSMDVKGEQDKAKQRKLFDSAESHFGTFTSGLLLFMAFSSIAVAGCLTGSYDKYDEDERAHMMANGIPYSGVNVSALNRLKEGKSTTFQENDLIIPVRYFGIPGMIGQLYANQYVEQKHEAEKNKKAFNAAELTKQVPFLERTMDLVFNPDVFSTALEQSFAAGINSVFEAISDPDQKGQAVIASLTQSAVAGLGVPATWSKAMEGTYVPNLKVKGNSLQTLKNVFAYRLYGGQDGVPTKVDAFGRKITQYAPKGTPHWLYASISLFQPRRIKRDTDDAVRTVEALFLKTGDGELIPAKYKLQDIDKALPDLEDKPVYRKPSEKMLEILDVNRGQLRLSRLHELMNSGDLNYVDATGELIEGVTFKQLPDEEKVKAIKYAYAKAQEDHIEFRNEFFRNKAKELGVKFDVKSLEEE